MIISRLYVVGNNGKCVNLNSCAIVKNNKNYMELRTMKNLELSKLYRPT